MVRKTRKNVKGHGRVKGLTIVQLRRAFEHIDSFVARKGDSVEEFRKEWKKTFGKDVSAKAAREYLDCVMSSKRMKKQNGGGSIILSPAPLNYELRAGGEANVSVPPYLSSGFGFANISPGVNDITPADPSRLGNNMVGGKNKKTRRGNKNQKGGSFLSQFSDFVQRPIIMNSPPTMANDAMMLTKGYNGFPSPLPQNPTFNYPSNPNIYSGYLSPSSKIV